MTGVGAPPDILTIDVEEWFHGHNYLRHVPPSAWERQERRVVPNTERCLELLARYDVRATFFVLGWCAERNPELVERIGAAGHEIACHSYAHPELYRLDEAAFRADTERALAALAAAGAEDVGGYRAPSFSLTPAVHGFLTVLRQLGFAYDCSLFPIRHPRYGQPDSPRRAFRLLPAPGAPPASRIRKGAASGAARDGDDLVVVPMTTWRLLGINVPFAGGGYLRLLPWTVYRYCRERALAQGLPNVIYLHPWELDDYRPPVLTNRLGRLRSQGGQETMPRKLERLLAIGKFQTAAEYVAERRRAGDLPRRGLPLA
jgi:polysaccharide deacetylase family protein (PEP-CTERM system associated)